MKRLFFILNIIFTLYVAEAQTMRASLGVGSQSNRIKIYLKSTNTRTPAVISTLQFNLAIDTTVKPKPNITLTSSSLPGVIWSISQAIEGSYYHYQFSTANSPIQFNTTANIEFEVMEVMFNGGPTTSNTVYLLTLPDGGMGASAGNSLFLSTGTLPSDGSSLYYIRSNVLLNNNFSYDKAGVLSGTTISSASIAGVSVGKTISNMTVLKTKAYEFAEPSRPLKIYPNPATNGVFVHFNSKDFSAQQVTFLLRNQNAQIVEKKVIRITDKSDYYFDLKDKSIPSGNYLLEVYENGKLNSTNKLIISN